MTFQKLDPQAAALRSATHEAVIKYTDLSGTAATSLTQTLAEAMPAGTRLAYVGHQVDTLFDGGATSELTAKIGWDLASGTDDDDGLMAATSLHADATYVKYGPAAVADVDSSTVDNTYGQAENDVVTSARSKLNTILKNGFKVFNDTADLEIVWTSTGANLTALTQGQVRFWFRINPPIAD
jgi:hypothetical protein